MNRLPGILVVLGAALLGLFAVASMVLSEGNVLANLFQNLIVGGCLLSLLAPRAGFVVFLVSCGYVDLFKRLMIVSGRVSMDDLYYVLGLAPAMLSAIIGSLLIRGTIGSAAMGRRHWKLFLVGCGIVMLNALLSALDPERSFGKVLQGTANGGLYGMLIFVVPMLYKDGADVLRLFRFLVWIYAPAGVYGIVQHLWGFQDFEIAYLMTGLSIEIKQLFTDRVRAFSTLNSPTALGAISAALLVMTLFLAFSRNQRRGGRMLSLPMAALFALTYLGALVASTSRSAFVMVLVMVLGAVCFQSRARTLLFYSLGGGAFAVLLVGARFFQDRLEWMTSVMMQKFEGRLSAETININTFSDRLQGFAAVLTNPDAYSWFGHGPHRGKDPTDPLYNHDLLSSTLVQWGAVPLAVLLVATVGFLAWTHSQILGIQDTGRRRIGAASLALVISLFAISITSGNVLSIFPVNTFFWLGVTATILVVAADAGNEKAARESAGAEWRLPSLSSRSLAH